MIKNCIFDFGGVLYKIAPEKSVKAFMEMQSENSRMSRSEILTFADSEEFKLYEAGKIDDSDFRYFIKSSLNKNANDKDIDTAWNLTLINKYEYADSIIDSIRIRFCSVLLSNTNSIHYKHFEPECKSLLIKFEKCFYSYQMKMRKPDAEIFVSLCDQMNFTKNETIFIDDSEINIQAAQSLGIHTYHINDEHRLEDLEAYIDSKNNK